MCPRKTSHGSRSVFWRRVSYSLWGRPVLTVRTEAGKSWAFRVCPGRTVCSSDVCRRTACPPASPERQASASLLPTSHALLLLVTTCTFLLMLVRSHFTTFPKSNAHSWAASRSTYSPHVLGAPRTEQQRPARTCTPAIQAAGGSRASELLTEARKSWREGAPGSFLSKSAGHRPLCPGFCTSHPYFSMMPMAVTRTQCGPGLPRDTQCTRLNKQAQGRRCDHPGQGRKGDTVSTLPWRSPGVSCSPPATLGLGSSGRVETHVKELQLELQQPRPCPHDTDSTSAPTNAKCGLVGAADS